MGRYSHKTSDEIISMMSEYKVDAIISGKKKKALIIIRRETIEPQSILIAPNYMTDAVSCKVGWWKSTLFLTLSA